MLKRTRWREAFALSVGDVAGHKQVRAAGIPADMTVAELVQGLAAKMGLPERDAEGRSLSYHVRSDSEGRHLHGSEIVGDVLLPNDHIVLQPNIQAG